MAQTLSQIQTIVQFEARDDNIALSSGTGLAQANAIYRRLCALLSFPELTREDTSLSTTAGTEAYTWPSSPVFIDLQKVEVKDPDDDLKYKFIAPAQAELEWSLEREKKQNFPKFYRRMHNGTSNVIQFAPTPHIGSLTIRLTGVIEPTAFTASSSTSIFLNTAVDEALAYLIASDTMQQRAFYDHADSLLKRAAELLSHVLKKEVKPQEIGGMAHGTT